MSHDITKSEMKIYLLVKSRITYYNNNIIKHSQSLSSKKKKKKNIHNVQMHFELQVQMDRRRSIPPNDPNPLYWRAVPSKCCHVGGRYNSQLFSQGKQNRRPNRLKSSITLLPTRGGLCFRVNRHWKPFNSNS